MTSLEPSIHDNSLYSYEFDARSSTLVLRTVYHHRSSEEFTDIWFYNVWAHHLESVLGHDILFEVEESEITKEIDSFGDLFERLKPHGWPRIDKHGASIEETIARNALRVWRIASSYGMSGLVIAEQALKVAATKYRPLTAPLTLET